MKPRPKKREEVARFIEETLEYDRECVLQKGSKVHYGKQELRELLDFIYGGQPATEKEKIK